MIPWLERQGLGGERWLVAHSFSGLFGLHTLWNEPDLFARYLLASPSIWWHDRSILDLEEQRAGELEDLDATVFMSAGEAEIADARDEEIYRMRENMLEMGKRLRSRSYPSLDLTWTVLAGESHSSTTSNAVNKGIRALYKKRRETADPFAQRARST